jgi:hypothetical protein
MFAVSTLLSPTTPYIVSLPNLTFERTVAASICGVNSTCNSSRVDSLSVPKSRLKGVLSRLHLKPRLSGPKRPFEPNKTLTPLPTQRAWTLKKIAYPCAWPFPGIHLLCQFPFVVSRPSSGALWSQGPALSRVHLTCADCASTLGYLAGLALAPLLNRSGHWSVAMF